MIGAAAKKADAAAPQVCRKNFTVCFPLTNFAGKILYNKFGVPERFWKSTLMKV